MEVADGKAETIKTALTNFLTEVDFPLDRVSGIGTDGANVMVGSKTGLVVRLQEMNPKIVGTWCIAHRLALVRFWAAKAVAYLQTVQTILAEIYMFYKYSACRYNKIRELQRIMDAKVRQFKKHTNVRWVSLHDRVQAMASTWGCLCLALGPEASNST